MTSITQKEFHKRFREYIDQQPLPKDDGLVNWKERWYVGHLFDFDKKLKNENLTVRAGFWVDVDGVQYEDEE